MKRREFFKASALVGIVPSPWLHKEIPRISPSMEPREQEDDTSPPFGDSRLNLTIINGHSTTQRLAIEIVHYQTTQNSETCELVNCNKNRIYRNTVELSPNHGFASILAFPSSEVIDFYKVNLKSKYSSKTIVFSEEDSRYVPVSVDYVIPESDSIDMSARLESNEWMTAVQV